MAYACSSTAASRLLTERSLLVCAAREEVLSRQTASHAQVSSARELLTCPASALPMLEGCTTNGLLQSSYKLGCLVQPASRPRTVYELYCHASLKQTVCVCRAQVTATPAAQAPAPTPKEAPAATPQVSAAAASQVTATQTSPQVPATQASSQVRAACSSLHRQHQLPAFQVALMLLCRACCGLSALHADIGADCTLSCGGLPCAAPPLPHRPLPHLAPHRRCHPGAWLHWSAISFPAACCASAFAGLQHLRLASTAITPSLLYMWRTADAVGRHTTLLLPSFSPPPAPPPPPDTATRFVKLTAEPADPDAPDIEEGSSIVISGRCMKALHAI